MTMSSTRRVNLVGLKPGEKVKGPDFRLTTVKLLRGRPRTCWRCWRKYKTGDKVLYIGNSLTRPTCPSCGGGLYTAEQMKKYRKGGNLTF